MLRGVDHATVGGVGVDCAPGQLLIYPPACVHQDRQVGVDPLEFLCLNFEWSRPPESLPYILSDRQGRVLELARWLYAEAHVRNESWNSFHDAGIALLAAEIGRLAATPPDDPLSSIYEYIQEHLADPISLDSLAACSGLNKFHLSRIFRARTGTTPMECVRQARLDYAHRMIMETSLPLREIAPMAGFANEYHLSRLLKARFGRGARQMRQSHTRNEEAIP